MLDSKSSIDFPEAHGWFCWIGGSRRFRLLLGPLLFRLAFFWKADSPPVFLSEVPWAICEPCCEKRGFFFCAKSSVVDILRLLFWYSVCCCCCCIDNDSGDDDAVLIFVVDGNTKAEHLLENKANINANTRIDVIFIDTGRPQLLLLPLPTSLRLLVAIVVDFLKSTLQLLWYANRLWRVSGVIFWLLAVLATCNCSIKLFSVWCGPRMFLVLLMRCWMLMVMCVS